MLDTIMENIKWLAILSITLAVTALMLAVFHVMGLVFGSYSAKSSATFLLLFKLSIGISIICLFLTIFRIKLINIILPIISLVISIPALYIDYRASQGVKQITELREENEKQNCGYYNLKELGATMLRYAEDNQGYLPEADNWCDVLLAYNPEISRETFKDPQNREQGFRECNIAFNRNLSGIRVNEISANTILLFEADGDWNLNGVQELLRTRYSKYGYICVLHFDQNIGSYWYSDKAISDFGSNHKQTFYGPPRWVP